MEAVQNRYTAGGLWWGFIKSYWPIYTFGFLSVALTDAMQVLWTRSLGWILDLFQDNKIPAILTKETKYDTFVYLFILIFLSRILLTLGRFGWRIFLARRTHYASYLLKTKIFDHARFFSRESLAKQYTIGNLMNAATSDVGRARHIYGFTLVAVADVFMLGLFSIWAMCGISVSMTLWTLFILAFIPLVVKKLSSLEIERYSQAQESLSNFNDLSSQAIATIRLQRMTQTGRFWEKKLLERAEGYRQKRLKAVYTSLNYFPVLGGASIISYIILFVLGIGYVMKGEMTIGDFVAMNGFIFLLQDPLMEIGFILSDFQKAFTSLNRLGKIFNEPKAKEFTATSEFKPQGEEVFKVKNLSFAYAKTERPIITDLSFVISKGERLGIKGPIGSGKSTLLQILAGHERNYLGSCQFFGHEVRNLDGRQMKQYLGAVLQKPFLFAETIRSNISLDLDVSDDDIWRVLKLTELAEDIKGFEHGLETSLGEWGINLSGGQKQRLTIARLLIRKPKVLFLDDCLSAVDTVTEDKILKNIDKELADTTIIWVAHRSSTLKYCDRILEMNHE